MEKGPKMLCRIHNRDKIQISTYSYYVRLSCSQAGSFLDSHPQSIVVGPSIEYVVVAHDYQWRA